MREIKFKYYYKNKYTKEIVSKIRDIKTIEDTEFEIINLENEHLELLDRCQYTGLKDKNGKEIYEGDVVECVSCKEKNRKYKVTWCDKFLGFILEHKKEKYQISIFNDFKIIGNVFENPELLEEEK